MVSHHRSKGQVFHVRRQTHRLRHNHNHPWHLCVQIPLHRHLSGLSRLLTCTSMYTSVYFERRCKFPLNIALCKCRKEVPSQFLGQAPQYSSQCEALRFQGSSHIQQEREWKEMLPNSSSKLHTDNWPSYCDLAEMMNKVVVAKIPLHLSWRKR